MLILGRARSAVQSLCSVYSRSEFLFPVRWKGKQAVPVITSEDRAELIVNTVLQNQRNKESPVLEISPGTGVFTRWFLEAGTQNLICASKEQPTELQSLMDRSDGMTILKWNFSDIFLEYMSPLYRTAKMSEEAMLDLVPYKNWEDEPALTAFGVMPTGKVNDQLLKHLIRLLLVADSSIYSNGRVEWFLLISPSNYRTLRCCEKRQGNLVFYKASGILVNLFYDIKYHLKVPVSELSLGYKPKRISETVKEPVVGAEKIRSDEMVLVQLTPKHDLYDNVVPAKEIERFYTFMEYILQKKLVRLIPTIESWVPECGLPMIQRGFSMMETVGSVSPERFLDLFQLLLTLPNYEGSRLSTVLSERFTRTPRMEQ